MAVIDDVAKSERKMDRKVQREIETLSATIAVLQLEKQKMEAYQAANRQPPVVRRKRRAKATRRRAR